MPTSPRPPSELALRVGAAPSLQGLQVSPGLLLLYLTLMLTYQLMASAATSARQSSHFRLVRVHLHPVPDRSLYLHVHSLPLLPGAPPRVTDTAI